MKRNIFVSIELPIISNIREIYTLPIASKKTGSGTKTVKSYDASDYRKAISGWKIKSSKIQTETYTTTTHSNTGWLETAPSNAVEVVAKKQYRWVESMYRKVANHQMRNMSTSLIYSFDDTTCLVVSPGTALSASQPTRSTYYYLKAGMLKSVLSKNVVQYADVLKNAIITGLNSTPDCEYFNILRNATNCTADEIDHSVMQTLQGLVADNLIIPEETLWTIPQSSERALASIGFITDGVCAGAFYDPNAINEVLSLDDDIFMIRMDETYYGEYDGEPDIAKEFAFEAVEGTTVNLKSLYTAGYKLSSIDENGFMNMLNTCSDSWVLPYDPPETTDVVGTYFGTTGCESHLDVAKALLRYEAGLIIDPAGLTLTEQIDNETIIETLNEKILSVISALNG